MDYYQRLLMELQCKYPSLTKAMETPMEFLEDSQRVFEIKRLKDDEEKDDNEGNT
jgi:hypothetical protein